MGSNDEQQTKEQAQATLDALQEMKQRAIASTRPPGWLIGCAALLFGAATGLSVVKDESPALYGLQIAAVGLFLATLVYWLVRMRQQGVIMPILPRNLAATAFWLLQGIVFIGVVVGATVLYNEYGFVLVPYAAALVNGCAFAWGLHNFPTGEWIPGASRR